MSRKIARELVKIAKELIAFKSVDLSLEDPKALMKSLIPMLKKSHILPRNTDIEYENRALWLITTIPLDRGDEGSMTEFSCKVKPRGNQWRLELSDLSDDDTIGFNFKLEYMDRKDLVEKISNVFSQYVSKQSAKARRRLTHFASGSTWKDAEKWIKTVWDK